MERLACLLGGLLGRKDRPLEVALAGREPRVLEIQARLS
jgi:hypothetical protein